MYYKKVAYKEQAKCVNYDVGSPIAFIGGDKPQRRARRSSNKPSAFEYIELDASHNEPSHAIKGLPP